MIKILTGSRLPDEGRIKWQRGVRIGYLDQYAESAHDLTIGAFLQSAFKELFEVQERQTRYYEEYAEKIDDSLLEKAGRCQEILEANDFYGIQTKIDQVMSGLGIDALGSNRQVSECSGGQRSKIILAKLLLEKPDVLLLDEPTNYLDTEHIEWLIDYLNGFEGCFMVISHDYDFLERITNTIVDVAFGKITKYTGSFRKAIRQKEEKRPCSSKPMRNSDARSKRTRPISERTRPERGRRWQNRARNVWISLNASILRPTICRRISNSRILSFCPHRL